VENEKIKKLIDELSLHLVALRLAERDRHEDLEQTFGQMIDSVTRIRRLLKGEPEEPEPIET
jgi:hypothetical protein